MFLLLRIVLLCPNTGVRELEKKTAPGLKCIPNCVYFGQPKYFWSLLLKIFLPVHTDYFWPINFTQWGTTENGTTRMYTLTYFCSFSWKMSSMLMQFLQIPFPQKRHSITIPIKGTLNSTRPTLLSSSEFKHLTADFMPEEFFSILLKKTQNRRLTFSPLCELYTFSNDCGQQLVLKSGFYVITLCSCEISNYFRS